jgi:hypothetical protein
MASFPKLVAENFFEDGLNVRAGYAGADHRYGNEGKRSPSEDPFCLDQVNEAEGVHGNVPCKSRKAGPLLLKRKHECHDVLS